MTARNSLEALNERVRHNRENNISYESGDLIAEVKEEAALYGGDIVAAVWCDPSDDFVKDYFVIDDVVDIDDEEREVIAQDRATFNDGKSTEDIYILTLDELLETLIEQDRIL